MVLTKRSEVIDRKRFSYIESHCDLGPGAQAISSYWSEKIFPLKVTVTLTFDPLTQNQ